MDGSWTELMGCSLGLAHETEIIYVQIKNKK